MKTKVISSILLLLNRITHMKNSFVLILFLSLSTLTIGLQAQTQYEMNQQAANDEKAADAELNRVYKQILTDYAEDTLFIKNLKASQRIWINFRDAEVKMKFPEREEGYYGSMHPMCISDYRAGLIRQRTAKLKEWLQPVEDGDGCEGSVNPR
ncbi:MAG: hypothetical protein RLZZ630_24 [Bacteroidota bacterium]